MNKIVFFAACAACISTAVVAQDSMQHHDHGAMAAPKPAASAEHQHDHSAMMATESKRSEVNYKLPKLALLRQDGKEVNFPAELDDGRPVVLQFMYTSCTTICPVTTQMFAQFQEKLGTERNKLHMLSISIDPEYDTPARLAAFAKKLDAGSQWQFYSGTLDASVGFQKAFDVFRGDKMNHIPVTFLRASPNKPWVRLDGLRGPDEILKEYKSLVGTR
jgi:protein SCO1/2